MRLCETPGHDRAPRSVLAVVLLIAVTLAVFGRVCRFESLVLDDDRQVIDNPYLNPPTWRSLGRFWTAPYWGLYIPLSYTFFAAEASVARQLWPEGAGTAPNPAVLHAGNLVLHVVCVCLVFLILRRLFRNRSAACVGALLFGLHPVQVESVAWISETRGTLCGVFSLIAIWLYLGPADGADSQRSAVGRYLLATAAFSSALLCKPTAVAVPLIAAVLDLGLLGRPLRRTLLSLGPWLLVAAGWMAVTKWQQPDYQLAFVPPLWARPLLAGDALAFYLGNLLVPIRLAPDYGRSPAWVMQNWWFYATWLVPVLGLMLLTRLNSCRVWLTAAAVSIACVLPVLGLVPFVFQRVSTVADRYLYLAMLGPAIVLTWLLAQHWTRPRVAAALAIICILATLSFFQSGHWRDNRTLLQHMLRVNPHSMLAGHNQGFLLAKEGKHAQAIQRYRDVLKHHPQAAEAYLGLGASLLALGRTDEAAEVLYEAVRRAPREPLIRCQLAAVLAEEGRNAEALSQYREALRHDADCIPAHLALGKLLLGAGSTEEAIRHFRAILDVDPNHVPARVNLGAALQALGSFDEAQHHYQVAIQTCPSWPTAHFNLGNLLAARGKYAEAEDSYRRALTLDPQHAEAHVNLANVLLQLQRPAAAIRHCRTALRIKPDLVPAHVNLGTALAAEGRRQEALAAFQAALKLVPPDSSMANQIRSLIERCAAESQGREPAPEPRRNQ